MLPLVVASSHLCSPQSRSERNSKKKSEAAAAALEEREKPYACDSEYHPASSPDGLQHATDGVGFWSILARGTEARGVRVPQKRKVGRA